MNHLVMILFDDDGYEIDDPVWHLVDPCSRGVQGAVLCTGEVYGVGESDAIYNLKTVKRGIPCPRCAEIIRIYKAVKL